MPSNLQHIKFTSTGQPVFKYGPTGPISVISFEVLLNSPEEILLYADTIIVGLKWQGTSCTIRYEDWSENIKELVFRGAEQISNCEVCRDRVEKGVLKKLNSGNSQLHLVDDDGTEFLVLEYRSCENI